MVFYFQPVYDEFFYKVYYLFDQKWFTKQINNVIKFQGQLKYLLISHSVYSIDEFVLSRWVDWNSTTKH